MDTCTIVGTVILDNLATLNQKGEDPYVLPAILACFLLQLTWI